MDFSLISAHIIIAEIIACILCVVLVFIVCTQTIYYLCIRKAIHNLCFKDEGTLSQMHNHKEEKIDPSIQYSDIHLFFRITTTISISFGFIACISSFIAISHLMLTNSFAFSLKYIHFICFFSWLFSHYSMSAVFVGRLSISFQDSVFQYSAQIIRILSLTLICLPILLMISFLFWCFGIYHYSLLFFVSFIGFDVLFSIVLTSLFIQKLYQLIRGRIIERTHTSKHRMFILDALHRFKRHKNTKHAVETAETVLPKQKTNDLHVPAASNEPEMKTESRLSVSHPNAAQNSDSQIPSTTIFYSVPSHSVMDNGNENEINVSNDYNIRINFDDMEIPSPSNQTNSQSIEIDKSPNSGIYGNILFKPQLSVSASVDSAEASPDPEIKEEPVSDISPNKPVHVRFSAESDVSELYDGKDGRRRTDSAAKRYMSRARSISRSITDPRHSKAFIDAKHKLDRQQLQLINNMTRHGLLLIVSSMTSLSCLIYILFTFKHYEEVDNYVMINDDSLVAYYYLYWNMGISSFLNALSLYLSFAFAQWFYIRACNKIHKWLEALCVIVIVKQLKLDGTENEKKDVTKLENSQNTSA